MSKRYAILGDLIAETVDFTIIAGGSGAIGLAIRELGGEVTLRSRIGIDNAGDEVIRQIKAARIHPGLIDRVEGTTASLIRHQDGSYTEWQPGVMMTKGGKIDTYALFGMNALVVDLSDQSLRHFIIDLPAHQDGTVRMLTTLSHLNHLEPHNEELDIAMRCDTIVGTEAQYAKLTGKSSASDALGLIFERMPMTHVRAAIAITDGGLEIISRDSRILKPVRDAVPSLLVPQVVAGIAWAMANHADWENAAAVCLDPASVN